MSEKPEKRFRIPNEDVKLTMEEASITQTRTFQRLFHLKQLGLAYLVYPCATHTRGGHSIQCLNEATKILRSLTPPINESNVDFSNVRLSALLHDIGHIPFSHTLEDEHEVFEEKHDKANRLNRVLDLLKKELPHNYARIIDSATPILLGIADKKSVKSDWRSDLVGNTVCADLLAYITTDAEWTGIEKRPGYYRIYDYFQLESNRLCIRLTKGGLRPDIVSAILDLLDMRYALTERVVFHHAKCIASGMLARAVRLSGYNPDDELLAMGDEQFLNHIEEVAKEGKSFESKGASMLIDSLRSRRLYKRIFKVESDARKQWDKRSKENDKFCRTWREGKSVEDLLRKIEDRHKLPRGALVLWCPKGKSGMKLVEAKVIWEHSDGWSKPVELRSEEVHRQFPGVWNRVQTIENQYQDLWTFWIAIHPEYIEKARTVIASLESELEIECDKVFLESYARSHLPGFRELSNLFHKVEDTWQDEFMPAVTSRLLDRAAREDSDVDNTIITDTIRSVAEEKVKPKSKGKRKARKDVQTLLFEEKEQD
jgi:HD superfamily phosphohydrolase